MIKTLLRGLMGWLFKVEVRGKLEQLHRQRLLIIANHQSFLDGLLLGLFLPYNAVFVVHTSVAKRWSFRPILSLVDYLAVDPSNPMAMKGVIKAIEAGRPVVIFPEGRITVTGSLMKVYEGPAFVAARTGATIVPVRLEGATRSYFSRTSGALKKEFFPRISLTVMPEVLIPMPNAPSAKLRRKIAGDAMRKIMQEMLFAATPPRTLFGALLDAIRVHGRATRVMEDMRQIPMSYAEILRGALALGRMSTRLAPAGARIGVLLPNLGTTACLIFGMSAFRRVPAMLNYSAGAQGMQDACVTAQVQVVITSRKFLESAKLTDTVAAMPGLRWVYLEDLQTSFGWLDKLWLVAFAQWFPRLATHTVDPEESAVVLFTSGSEGKPKGVVLSHRALLANVAQICAVIDFSPDDKFMCVLPIFHAFGLTAGAIMPLVTGTPLFLYPSPLHYKVIPEVIYDRGCTVLFGTSTFLGHYAKYANPYDFFRMRYVVAGAEKLNEEVRKSWFEKFGIRILEGYGATECAPVLAVNTPMAYLPGSVGQLLPGMGYRIEPVPGIEGGGILHVSGPNLMSGYYLYDHPGELVPPKSDIGAGWYNTGDVVEVDAAGFITIKGRVKRFAKIAGEMVSLEAVEKIATQASPEHQHAAVSQADAQRGEALVLYTTDGALKREHLLEVARANGSAEIAVPKKILVLESIPLLGTGKTDYVTLKKMAESA
jgi:acyl-[acyl-carrier-protein]-phospholipid O-acyltransferase/long-chain-fatty-acid--[acyl-carrier-protein] ligase